MRAIYAQYLNANSTLNLTECKFSNRGIDININVNMNININMNVNLM